MRGRSRRFQEETQMAGAPSALLALNNFVRKHFVHLISVTALIAFFTPGISQAVRAHKFAAGRLDASGLSLFLMMLSAAIQCSLAAFRKVVARPRSLLVCLAQFFVVLPASCWLLGQLCVPLLGRALGEPIQIGLDLVILMPVAATATIWVRDSRGDIELLVALVLITMSLGTLVAPVYLSLMSGLAANSIVIPRLVILRQLVVGVLLPLFVGIALNRLLRKRLPQVQPWFAMLGNLGLFTAVFLNVGTASPLLRQLSLQQVSFAMLIVLAVNLSNFILGAAIGRAAGLGREQQTTWDFATGMRSNGTALVVGLASFPHAPLVTVPAAIYIIFQHLIASVVRSRAEKGQQQRQAVTAEVSAVISGAVSSERTAAMTASALSPGHLANSAQQRSLSATSL
jgi:bile acid:Na+ symporter, BASS family